MVLGKGGANPTHTLTHTHTRVQLAQVGSISRARRSDHFHSNAVCPARRKELGALCTHSAASMRIVPYEVYGVCVAVRVCECLFLLTSFTRRRMVARCVSSHCTVEVDKLIKTCATRKHCGAVHKPYHNTGSKLPNFNVNRLIKKVEGEGNDTIKNDVVRTRCDATALAALCVCVCVFLAPETTI